MGWGGVELLGRGLLVDPPLRRRDRRAIRNYRSRIAMCIVVFVNKRRCC
jgi:hypothetical protein